MSRAYVQAQPNPPLANTGTGAAGTVLGTERQKLQGVATGAQVNVVEGATLQYGVGAQAAVPIGSKIMNFVLRLATAALDGLMSASDKAKLDGIGTAFRGGVGTLSLAAPAFGQNLSGVTINDSGQYLLSGFGYVYAPAVNGQFRGTYRLVNHLGTVHAGSFELGGTTGAAYNTMIPFSLGPVVVPGGYVYYLQVELNSYAGTNVTFKGEVVAQRIA